MAVAVAVAHRPGAEEIVRARPRPSGRCGTPGCSDRPLEGGRFCAPHQARLDRIRAELDGDKASGANERRWREQTTRGMKGTNHRKEASDGN